MKLKDKILELERQRDEQLRQASLHFTRLKHRMAPRHLIKSHPAAATLLAFASGFAAAPARGAKPKKRPSFFNRLVSMAGGVRSGIQATQAAWKPETEIPPPPAPEPAPPAQPQGSLLFTRLFDLTPNSAIAVSLHWLKQKPATPISPPAEIDEEPGQRR
jgi:hypothetical protein